MPVTRSGSGKTRGATQTLCEPARAALAHVGLSGRADTPVGKLSHGEQRQLEIAMALATKPRLLLLDEPMAGMGPEESARMVGILRELKGSITTLLIEHDMETVFALADRITVLVYGRVIASGDPAVDPCRRRRARSLSRRAGGQSRWLKLLRLKPRRLRGRCSKCPASRPATD